MALSFEPGASVARIDREYGVNANQVLSWRRLYEQGRFGLPALMRYDGLLPVMLAPSAPALSNAIADATADADVDVDVDEIIELKLGEVRVHIEGQPCATSLA